MKQYRVIVTSDAKEDLRKRLSYLLYDLQNPQAFDNVLDDYEQTITALATSAGILRLCDSPALAARGLHRINFRSHDYFMLYYIDDDVNGEDASGEDASGEDENDGDGAGRGVVHVTNIFHHKEDYENKLR